MRAAVTISLVPEARRGPFVFHVDPDPTVPGATTLEACCRQAAELGFDAVEIFAADAETLRRTRLRDLLVAHGLGLAAIGTGAGWVRHGLHLCDADASRRTRAADFIAALVDAAAELGAPAIIGSMQGRSTAEIPRAAALDLLADSLGPLAERASHLGQPLLYEPLNRYETDLLNTQADAAAFLEARGLANVRLLCDLFHMAIEEADPPAVLRAVGRRIGHVHWADSNRRAMGLGHTPAKPLAAALRDVGFAGHLSAEVLPLPSSAEAAAASITSIRRLDA